MAGFVDDLDDLERSQAQELKEEGNSLVRQGKKAEALRKYEKGIRLLGLTSCSLDEDGEAALRELSQETRELVSILASNAAQMYMDPGAKQLGLAIERCTLAIEANPSNAKAYFRRATAAYDHADNVATGAHPLLAQAQKDVCKFLECDPQSPAGAQLQERLGRKKQQLAGPMLRESAKEEPAVEPDWFQQVKKRAIFVCMCGTKASGRDQVDLPASLLSMAKYAKDKNAISVGVAYVGYKGPDELEMFDAEWQKKYFRMLRLSERATRVPEPRQVVVHGEVYNVWSLLEGRIRVMRVSETKQNGEKVGSGWMRYCAQLLWHGEPFMYQSSQPYLRFAPKWDDVLKNDLAAAMRKSQARPVLSWMPRWQEQEPWQWKADTLDHEDRSTEPAGALVAIDFEKDTGWIRFRRRYFADCYRVPVPVAFWTPHSSFSTSEVLLEVPADPFLNALAVHCQVTCENVRLHTQGWDVFAPTVNVVWEALRECRPTGNLLSGKASEECNLRPVLEIRDPQTLRCDALLDLGEARVTPLDEEILDVPVPTACFWTTLRPGEPSPWETGRQVGPRFGKGIRRPIESFERATGVEMARLEVSAKARNGGFNGDKDFEDSEAAVKNKWDRFEEENNTSRSEMLERYHGGD